MYVDEQPVCWWKTFTYMQLQFVPSISEGLMWSRDDDEGYIGVIDSFFRFISVLINIVSLKYDY